MKALAAIIFFALLIGAVASLAKLIIAALGLALMIIFFASPCWAGRWSN